VKVVITGGGGFLGRTLGRRLLDRGALTAPSGREEAIDRLVLLDVAHGPASNPSSDPRIELVTGDVTDAEFVRGLVDRDDISVFHLASMVSSGCEVDFDGAFEVNIGGGQAIFEACRARASRPRLVFTSSLAAFGGEGAAGVASDTTKLMPETTYGITKAICELLVNDYTRKGFLDGRSARLPTVVIRPGRPNAAASSWVSGIFREPLNGEEAVLPVDVDTSVPLSGYRTVVDNLIRLHEVEGEAIGADRGMNLPALTVTAQDMIDSLQATVGDRPLGPVTHKPDPLVARIFAGWAERMASDRATRLGLVADESLEPIIKAYIEDFAPA
jgi:nucleoside-diphosphate-sugar epimerase